MTRKRKVLILSTVGVLVAGVAGATLLLRLDGSGSVSGFAGIDWQSANGTNDDGTGDGDTGPDPSGPGMTPTRESFNIGSSALTFNAGTLVMTITDGYSGYQSTSHAVAGSTGTNDFLVQRVVVGGADAASIEVTLDPAACGKSLLGSSDREVDVNHKVLNIADGGTLAYSFTVEVADSASFNPALCNPWS